MIKYRGTDPERHVELLQEVIVLRDKEIGALHAQINELEARLVRLGYKRPLTGHEMRMYHED